MERKAFLKSFVDRVEVDKAEATVVYTLPILPDTSNGGGEAVGVLPCVSDGPPLWIKGKTFSATFALAGDPTDTGVKASLHPRNSSSYR